MKDVMPAVACNNTPDKEHLTHQLRWDLRKREGQAERWEYLLPQIRASERSWKHRLHGRIKYGFQMRIIGRLLTASRWAIHQACISLEG